MDLFTSDDLDSPHLALKFYADWCGPCRALEKVVNTITTDVPFRAINTDDSPELAKQYGVRSLPTLLFMRSGQEIDRITGMTSKDIIQEKLELLTGDVD